MKKILTLLLAAAVILSCMPGTVFAAGAGETVTVTFSVSSNPGFAAFGARIRYDSNALTLVSIEAGSMLSSGMFVGNASNGWVAYAGTYNITGNGTLFTAKFQIKNSAAPGTYAVDAAVDTSATFNEDDEPVSLSIYGGSVVVECNHSWGAWTETPATCTEAGAKTRKCNKCDAVETVEIPALGHDFGGWVHDAQAHWRKCSRCNQVADRANHNYNGWKYDENNHWHECSTCHTTADKSAHSKRWVVIREATDEQDGLGRFECRTCTWKGPDVVILKDNPTEPPETAAPTETVEPETAAPATVPETISTEPETIVPETTVPAPTGQKHEKEDQKTFWMILALAGVGVLGIVVLIIVIVRSKRRKKPRGLEGTTAVIHRHSLR